MEILVLQKILGHSKRSTTRAQFPPSEHVSTTSLFILGHTFTAVHASFLFYLFCIIIVIILIIIIIIIIILWIRG